MPTRRAPPAPVSQAQGLALLGQELRRLGPLPEATLAALSAITSVRSYPADAYLLEGGDQAEWAFLVVRGLVREHYLGADGEEHTRTFVPEGQFTGSLYDLLSGEPSVTWLQALEPTEVLAWRYSAFDALCAKHPALQMAARRSAEGLYMRKIRREHEMLALGAAERYRRWRSANPALDARITRRHLASYLGVTPEHLSRLARSAKR